MGKSTKSEAEIEADEVIDTFAELVRQRDELRAELERVQANHVTVAEEIQRRHDACAPLTAEIVKLRSAGNAVIDSCEMWEWLLDNGGMLPGTGYMNMTVKLGALWELAEVLGRANGA